MYIDVSREADEWLGRVNHDLVKRLLWPARDRRALGGPVQAGELVVMLADADGNPQTAEETWRQLRAEAPPVDPRSAGALRRRRGRCPRRSGRPRGRSCRRAGAGAGVRNAGPESEVRPQPLRPCREHPTLEVIMPRLLVIDDRDQTVQMCHRQLPQFDYVTRCDRSIPCQVCEERDRGCALQCAHDYQEAEEVLADGRGAARPGHPGPAFRPPRGAAAARGQVAPAGRTEGAQGGGRGPAPQAGPAHPGATAPGLSQPAGGHVDHHRRRAGGRPPRRSAGLLLPERGGRQPQPGGGDHPGAGAGREPARGGGVLGPQPADGGAAAIDRRAGPVAAAGAGRRGDGHGQELPGRTRAAPAFRAERPAGGHRSVDHSLGAAARAPVRRPARGVHRRDRGSRRRVRAGAWRHACSSTRSPTWIWTCSGSCCWCWNGGRSPGWATASRGPRRPSWWPPPTRTWRRWSARGGSAATCTCA